MDGPGSSSASFGLQLRSRRALQAESNSPSSSPPVGGPLLLRSRHELVGSFDIGGSSSSSSARPRQNDDEGSEYENAGLTP